MDKKLWTYLLFFGFLSSCIYPIENFEQQNSTSFLTIEAELSNEVKAHEVRLTISSDKLGLTGSVSTPVEGARVFVEDDKGTKEEFVEQIQVKGLYLSSSNFAGKIGSKYVLNVQTINGNKYQSVAEELKIVPDIENPIVKFETNTAYLVGYPERNRFNVFIDLEDSKQPNDFYQWFWKHYELTRVCETCFGPFGDSPYGANFNYETNECNTEKSIYNYYDYPVELNYSCDEDCYTITKSEDFNILSDSYLNGKRITGRQVASLPFDNIFPYYLQLEQRSITKSAFIYFTNLNEQIQNNGTLFDVPSETKFNFNIKSLTDPSEKIAGIFNVYGVKKRVFYIDRSKLITKDEIPTINKILPFWKCPILGACPKMTCRESIYRTKFKPEGYKD
jgi:hypothetical protein